MNFITPKNLKPSSTIAFVSIAGNIDDEKNICVARDYFECKGYSVKCYIPEKSCGYLGGSDKERLECLYSAFLDESVDMIISVRGGYGSLRLIDKIDWSILKNNPKIFVGYSDITALILMLYKNTGMVSYHGPMVCSDFGSSISKFTEVNFFDTVMTGFKGARVTGSFNGNNSEGILWGGNLATIASLCGLDFVPDIPFVFFVEDVDEPVYKIDRMITQLTNVEKFRKNIKSIILGDFTGIDDNVLLEDFFKKLAASLGIPLFFGLKAGHGQDKLTLPVGMQVSVKDLTILPTV